MAPVRVFRRLTFAVRVAARILRGTMAVAGLLALVLAFAQFTPWPWRAYRRLGELPEPSSQPPTHILVMGGSGIPGPSGLMRTFYAAEAAGLHPDADVLVAMPLDANQSEASQAYLQEIQLRGVLPERLSILSGGRNTREQALRMLEHLGQDATNAVVLIVSDPSHIRRTAACLRKVGVPHLAAMPAHPLSIEDPMIWRVREMQAQSCSEPVPGAPSAAQPLVPDVGSSLVLRYSLWNNLAYSHDSFREYCALLYYRLLGWI